MLNKSYRAFVTEEHVNSHFSSTIKEQIINQLPQGELLIKMHFSSLNYKDALSASGNKGVTRNYPHTPGIDASGIVEFSSNKKFIPGDKVIVTSYDLGMNTSGGFGEYIRVPAEWVLKLPTGLSAEESMILGTAGFTAGMAIYQIVSKIKPDQGEILVTGAAGGLGCLAVAILSGLGYQVSAGTGKTDQADWLKRLGAANIVPREELLAGIERPLLKPRWSAVIDAVGGDILSNALKSTLPNGVVAVCGNALSNNLNINVFPFILRGVSMVGIDSQNCPMPHRQEIWSLLAHEWKPNLTDDLFSIISLEQLNVKIEQMLQGKITGRIVIKHKHQ